MTPDELYTKAGGRIDPEIFGQILDMDDDEELREFSKAIVMGFFEQAEQTDQHIKDALKGRDLKELSSLGHFLKGSSATLGLTKVKDSCEKIQHLGQGKDETGVNELNEDDSLKEIKTIVDTMKIDLKEVETLLKEFYPPDE